MRTSTPRPTRNQQFRFKFPVVNADFNRFHFLVYKGESESLRSLLLKTAEKVDQDHWMNSGQFILVIIRIIFAF